MGWWDQGTVLAVAALATAAGGSVTTIATLLYQGWTRGRDRRWDLEDRKEAAAAANAHAVEIKELARLAATKAGEAYNEANHVNEKLHALGVSIQAGAVVPAHVPDAAPVAP